MPTPPEPSERTKAGAGAGRDEGKGTGTATGYGQVVALFRRVKALPGGPLLLLRLFLGFTFTFAGLQKLANPNFFKASAPGSIQQQLIGAAHSTPVHFLVSLAQHSPVTFGIVIAIGELAIGLGTFFGFLTRIAACAGMLLSLTFFLTVSYATWPFYYGSDIVFLFAWTPLAISGAGAFSLDGRLAAHLAEQRADVARRHASARASSRRLAEIDRRSAISRGLTAVGLGVAAVVLGGVDAAIGSALAPSAKGTTGKGKGKGIKGIKVAAASSVPVGGATAITDPTQQLPAWLVQPTAGQFLAISAICTHAACTVAFDRQTETFNCPCHGSIFDAKTGAVVQGPASSPLPTIPVTESGGELFVNG